MFSSQVKHYCRLLGSFHMASWNHSVGVLWFHLWIATCLVSLPPLSLHTQLNTVLHAGAISQQISDNCWISDSVTPSFHRSHRGAFLLMIIAFHLVTLVHVLWPLDLVVTHQVSQSCTTRAMWWWSAVLDYTMYLTVVYTISQLVVC